MSANSDNLPRHRTPVQQAGLLIGPLVALLLATGPRWGLVLEPSQPMLNPMAAVAAWMAIWWISEALPLAATALLPLVLFPLLKIPPGHQIALRYGHPLLFLFLGGFLLAIAIEQSGLHRRFALSIVAAVGDNPRRITLGFMLATASLSMWLSNTATTLMVLPIALSVLSQAPSSGSDEARTRQFGVALLLAVAYSASIGGIATLIGTPPNVAFKAIFEDYFPGEPAITFGGWMVFAFPFSAALLAVAWWLLTFVVFAVDARPLLGGSEVVRQQLFDLGPMRPAERRMLTIFVATAVLWILREPVASWGWAPWLGLDRLDDGTVLADDGTVAIGMALLCFIVPSGGATGGPLLTWDAARRLPWGILLLFGGGMALAQGLESTGLDAYLGRWLAARLGGLSQLGIIAAVTAGTTFFTELTSNLASVNMLLPVLAGTSEQLGLDPRLLMIPATLAASCAFMLPVATPPNAIVYGSGRIRTGEMVRAGLLLNIAGILLTVLLMAVIQAW
ncbi:MAG: SLC13 family permease [Pirellulales bacterium]